METVNLTELETYKLLAEYDIPVVEHAFTKSPEEGLEAAESLGWPVVCKVVSPDIIHKSRVGGVVTALKNQGDLINAYNTIVTDVKKNMPEANITGCLIAKQATQGLAEVIVGGLRDVEFGPSVMIGAGGEFAEVLRCVSFGPPTTNQETAREMIENVRSKLSIHPGWKSLNSKPLADVIIKLGRLIVENHQIESIDLNPVIAYTDSYLVVDSKAIRRVYSNQKDNESKG